MVSDTIGGKYLHLSLANPNRARENFNWKSKGLQRICRWGLLKLKTKILNIFRSAWNYSFHLSVSSFYQTFSEFFFISRLLWYPCHQFHIWYLPYCVSYFLYAVHERKDIVLIGRNNYNIRWLIYIYKLYE